MFLYLNSVYAVEANSEDKLTFLKGTSKYLDGDSSRAVLRPLKEFKVGKKYCLWGTKNWDDACQDAAIKYAFGPKWQEFKLIALEFVELVQKNDIEEFTKWSRYPFEICNVGDIRGSCRTVKNATEFRPSESLYLIPTVKEAIHKNEATYKNFLIGCESNQIVYSIYICKNVQILFKFDTSYKNNSDRPEIEYFPILSRITSYE